ncbi:MAG: glycosyltransferase family 9 protein [Nibricoccus sp.]
MLKLLLQSIGWLLAHTPQFLLRTFSWLLGHAIFYLLRRRRRLFFSNLDHAFPERTRAWQAKIARQSSCRFVETALLSFASPFISDTRLRRIASATPEVTQFFIDHHAQPYPLIVAAPHIAYWESLTTLGLFMDVPMPEFGVIFRPLDNPTADAWVKATRERHGMRLLSRKDGLAESFRILRRKGVVGVLFDQNAGLQGALSTLFGRVCSTSELSGMLVERSGARIMAFYPRRLGFWKLRLEAEEVRHDGTTAGAMLALNRWLETKLSTDDNLCASWLWSHDRWRHQDIPEKRLRLESKRNLLAADLASRGLATVPHKTRLFIRMPNWLGDVVMALPLLRALRASRPDAEITLIAKASFFPLLKDWAVADRLEALPQHGPGYFLHFWKFRERHPDIYLLFTNSLRGDLEAWLTGCRQRFGILRPGKHRPLLTRTYAVPANFDEREHHQLELWENFLRAFGLDGPLLREPQSPSSKSQSPAAPSFQDLRFSTAIGLIAGSENNPEKRWPVEHWRNLLAQLLEKHPDAEFLLLGTANDRSITAAIAAGLDSARVHDLAGKTNLPAYIEKLRSCRLLITNDTGGMHLANALGVPLLALFGPTNPVRTGPVFSAPFEILQPPNCPKTGSASLIDLAPTTVLEATQRLLASGSRSPTSDLRPLASGL